MNHLELIDIAHRFAGQKVLVIGDVVLDRYTFGFAERISQEAPVPVLRVDRVEDRLGGAAGVATMIAGLGGQATLFGVVGSDASGAMVRETLSQWGIPDTFVLEEPGRPTTFKARFIGLAQNRHPQQLLRVDNEVCHTVAAPTEARLAGALREALASCDIALVSDYGKGVCTPQLLQNLLGLARAMGKRVLVDPVPGRDVVHYHGANCLTPNRQEASLATGVVLDSVAQAGVAATRLRNLAGAEAVAITLDRDGIYLSSAESGGQHFPTQAREVYDVTGAGDMVLSVLGLCLAAGAPYEAALPLCNVAAGLEIQRLGAAVITRQELLGELGRDCPQGIDKVWPRPALSQELHRQRLLGRRIVFANGCFDLLHAGHVWCLNQARSFGDLLVVGLNSDASVKRLKGPGRPFNGIAARAAVLSALAAVDYVVAFEEDTPCSLLEDLRPDVLVKGGDYRVEEVVGREIVEAYGGRVVTVPFMASHSTTDLAKHAGLARVVTP